MTRSEAENLKSFDHFCTCGGYAYTMNGRDPRYAHMEWCPQATQYLEWYCAMHPDRAEAACLAESQP